MGMFDWVEKKPVKCPICGREINEFQSKDGFKKLLKLTPEQLVEDAYRMWGEIDVEYYGYCYNNCGAFYYTYDRKKREWKEEFLTNEELYGQKD